MISSRSPNFETRNTSRDVLQARGENRRTNDPKDLANAKRLREQWNKKARPLGLTQAKAAKLLNVSQPLIAQYLTGVLPLNERFVLHFARLLNIKPSDIDPNMTIGQVVDIGIPSLKGCTMIQIADDTYAPRIQSGDTVALSNEQPKPNELVYIELKSSYRIGIFRWSKNDRVYISDPNEPANEETKYVSRVINIFPIKGILCK